LLQTKFETLPCAEWLRRLIAADIPAAAIQTVAEALNDAQTLERGLIVEIEHPTLKLARSIANPVRSDSQQILYRLPPPLLGEHNQQILAELDLSPGELQSALQTACRAAKPTKGG
jgi:crotonobetainyl-CoA:carnitine CoA-transferase CaiB-like acyl-CoA transferase